ncbi:putative mannan endo-1,4-beta-mannosidase A [Psilocybe cubensis]|uniref:Mannan endo-1,4-beta-mannosidase A n=1 Tax=Psilocybe cubensis TaxID=181762 RepID=A0ACB8H2M5_PSICU|nr:putative mannan endo-1,4-beta-mannosidase A [Psilocybe cubensis]KAH9482260.1 putative mannan endo-1,4-beta-mannosidase A [Psilocybe cubensis]
MLAIINLSLAVCTLLLGCASSVAVGQSTDSLPKGFATQRNGKFEVDGKPFVVDPADHTVNQAFVGANSYWLPLLTSENDVRATFREMQGAGIKVLRTWGFNAINGSELAGAKQSGLTYYQVWNSNEWELNDGPQGLERLDFVVKTAGDYGIKIILAFTNNWLLVDFQGWIWKRYVTTIVNRYKSSPNIFAWEMMNEARCLGDLPAGPNCAPGTELLTKWYKQQTDFVRSLSAGEDFDEELFLENVDFGTYHLYPQTWYPELDFPGSNFTVEDWGLQWIQMHADCKYLPTKTIEVDILIFVFFSAAKKANKPVILEEFGLIGIHNKSTIYPTWVDLALKTEHGIMPWQFGMLGLKENNGNRLIKYADALIDGASPNDGFAIYQNQTAVWNIFTNAAKVQASRSG